jgi:phosphatidate cytidylyltransferase
MEGVRILGAEEAQAALEQQGRAPARPERGERAPVAAPSPPRPPDEEEAGDRTDEFAALRDQRDDERDDIDVDVVDLERDETAEFEALGRPRRYPDAGPSWSASSGTVPAPDAEAAEREPEVPPLPHWTEPPTGAVPAIFADDDADADADLEAWASLTGSQPRFRAEGSDWAEADYHPEELSDEHLKIGALTDTSPRDEEAEFAEAFEARRRRGPRGRAARTMVATPPPARRTAAPAPVAPEVEEGLPPTAPGRDLPTAIVTAAGVVVAALICFRLGTAWTALLVAVIMGVAVLELSNALRSTAFRPATLLVLVGAVTFPFAARTYGVGAYPVFFGLVVVFTMLWFLWQVTPGRPIAGIASSLLLFGYIGGLGGFAGLLLGAPDGVGLVIGVAACAVAYDVLGYFVGSQFGKSPIAPRISPHKTFEGTIAGMSGSIVVGWMVIGGAIGPGLTPWTPGRGAVLGLFVAVGAFLGDLCESMLKRDLGIKDFGSLLPGHGGVLDRFDGILFSLPIAYFLALHFNVL